MAPKGSTPAMIAAGKKRRKPIPEGALLVDPESASLVGDSALHLHSTGYVYFTSGPFSRRTLHSVVMGGTRKGMHIDHINGNKLDNRKVNLRFVTPGVNQINQKKLQARNTSGFRGVSPVSGSPDRWRARVSKDGKEVHLGCFSTPEEAKEARRRAEIELWGEECPT